MKKGRSARSCWTFFNPLVMALATLLGDLRGFFMLQISLRQRTDNPVAASPNLRIAYRQMLWPGLVANQGTGYSTAVVFYP
jgi:hypothetical protein